MSRRQAWIPFPRARGYSLVEIMVGLTVGLVTVLIITQVLATFQASRNSSFAGGDAQENALFAMQAVATDVRAAGSGYTSTASFNPITVMNCNTVHSYDPSNGTACGTASQPIAAMSGCTLTGGTAIANVPLAPILIEKYDGNWSESNRARYAVYSDIITLRSAVNLSGSIPSLLGSTMADLTSANPIPVKRSYGFATNDLILLKDAGSSPSPCAVLQVTGVDNTVTPSTLLHAASTSGTPNFNPPSLTGWPTGLTTTWGVFRIGNSSTGAITAREFSINSYGNALMARDIGKGTPPTSSTAVASGIVALKAQYGIASSATSPSITSWVGTDSSTWATTWSPDVLTYANYQLIRAIRLVVVARAGNREINEVTTACATVGFGTGPCPWSGPVTGDPVIDLTAMRIPGGADTATEWKHYRYKVYTTVIPLRNILWNSSWSFQNQ